MANLTLLEKQKKEAVKRLNKYFNLRVLSDFQPVKRFKEENTIFFQEYQNSFFDGVLWECNGSTCEGVVDKAIKEFNETHPNDLVYYALLHNSEFGRMVDIFFIPKNENEWEEDHYGLENNCPFVYVANIDDPYLSEFGSIIIRKANMGGIKRVG